MARCNASFAASAPPAQLGSACCHPGRAGGMLAEAGAGLYRANEGAHELAFDLWRKRIDVDALPSKKLPRILDRVDPRRLDADRAKSGRHQLVPIVLLAQRTGDATDPQQDLLAQLARHLAARDDVGY